VSFRFYSVPAHRLTLHPAPLQAEELFEPDLPFTAEAVERALSGAEFRDMRARDRIRSLVGADVAPVHSSPGKGWGPSAIFAQPPNDLPALLRLADHLEVLAKDESGERALVWKCECGTRYAVPVSLVRPVSIRCERCGRAVELVASQSLGEEALLDPFQGIVNSCRRLLAEFFREAMARGWPVMVSGRDI
jgi:hypothetical protein